MRVVLAIASVALRSAIRSRVLFVLAVLLVGCAIALPLTIRGDGTIEGHVRILLSYTLGSAVVLLSISAVWAGCAAIAAEVREHYIHLLTTKPVHPFQIWLGKWLALLAFHGVLLAAVFAMATAMLLWTTRPEALDEEARRRLREEILVARRSVRPREEGVEEAARKALEAEREAGRLPAEADPEEMFRAIRHIQRVRFYAVPPNAVREWIFPLPKIPDRDRQAFLQFRFAKSELNLEAVSGQWRWGPSDAPRGSVTGVWTPEARHTVPLPSGAFGENREFRLSFGNTDPSGVTVFFDPDTGMELLIHERGFTGNLLRAGLVLFAQIAGLCALGLSAGALFSMPVASFVSVVFVLFIQLGGYIGAMAAQRRILVDDPNAGGLMVVLDALVRGVFRVLRVIIAPLQGPPVLDWIAEGRLIPGSAVASMFAWHAVIYAGILALGSAWVLRRRELGNPAVS